MDNVLIEILSSFGYPVYRQGSMSDDATYPDTFFTYWNYDSPDHNHYDNTDYGTEWDFNIYVYSNDPDMTYNLLASARAALKSAGWICQGKGFDVQSDEETHTGRGLNVIYMEF